MPLSPPRIIALPGVTMPGDTSASERYFRHDLTEPFVLASDGTMAVPSVPGYYEAVSHSGITLGPVIGRLLASEILSGKPDRLLADFRPERFAR